MYPSRRSSRAFFESRIGLLLKNLCPGLSREIARVCACREKDLDDLFLANLRFGRSAAASSSGEGSEAKGSRSALVRERHRSAVLEECLYCAGAALPHSPMQGRDATLVEGIWVGAVLD